MTETWSERHAVLLERAKELRGATVVSRQEVLDLQAEIRDLERRIDRPLPKGTIAINLLPKIAEERPGRAPIDRSPLRPERDCPLRSCDGSGWHLHETEDVAAPCRCQELPRDPSTRRQNRRILRRHLALGLDSPPLSDMDASPLSALRDFSVDIETTTRAGRGLWWAGGQQRDAACAFIAGQALREKISVMIYPVDELIGRLRRLSLEKNSSLESEIYERLSGIGLLILTDLDAAANPSRYPEQAAKPDDPPEDLVGDQETSSKGADPQESPVSPYQPGMTDIDLSRLIEIIDQRWMEERSTVISTTSRRPEVEERLLRVAGWPEAGIGDRNSSEPRRRVHQVRRLLRRLNELSGGPLFAE